MKKRYLVGALVVVALVAVARNCRYGAEKQDVPDKYRNAHLTAVSAQNLLKQKKYEEALAYYEAARAEMEHEAVGADKGEDLYVNYGFVCNDIGVIRLAWALYGRPADTTRGGVDPEKIDRAELAAATASLEAAVAFYHRWYAHNPREYERYARAVSESLANLGVAYKYAGERDRAVETFGDALRFNPRNGNAERSLGMLGVDPAPFREAGEQALRQTRKFRWF